MTQISHVYKNKSVVVVQLMISERNQCLKLFNNTMDTFICLKLFNNTMDNFIWLIILTLVLTILYN